MIPRSASCYSCHSEHGAVDTTFVQFYPTLLPIARSNGTLSGSYVKERRGSRTAFNRKHRTRRTGISRVVQRSRLL